MEKLNAILISIAHWQSTPLALWINSALAGVFAVFFFGYFVYRNPMRFIKNYRVLAFFIFEVTTLIIHSLLKGETVPHPMMFLLTILSGCFLGLMLSIFFGLRMKEQQRKIMAMAAEHLK